MKCFCRTCGTEALHQEICSGCGSMMQPVSDKHRFILEVVDQVLSNKMKEAVIYERRGPFDSAVDADNWWKQAQDHSRYIGCEGVVALLEPPQDVMVDKGSN